MQGPTLTARYVFPFWAALLCLLFGSCSDRPDRDVSSTFAKNRAIFETIAKLGLSTDLSCQTHDGDLQCNNPAVRPLFEALHKNADVKAIQASNDIPQLGNSVYFVMASYGLITTNSYSKGIAYSTASLTPTADNTADHPDMRFRFKPLADHWYVFVMP